MQLGALTQGASIVLYEGSPSHPKGAVWEVAARIRAFLDSLLEAHIQRHGPHSTQEGPVLAVGHSSTNRILMCVALGLPIREFRQRFVQGQANITVLRFEHGDGASDARLLVLNDTAHLQPAGTLPWS